MRRSARFYLLPRHARLLELMQEKGDLGVKSTKKDLLLEAGYSENTARKPAQVFGSASFREVFSGIVSDQALVEAHKDLLCATESKTLHFPSDMEDADIARIIESLGQKLHHIGSQGSRKNAYVTCPAYRSIQKALDLAYKVM